MSLLAARLKRLHGSEIRDCAVATKTLFAGLSLDWAKNRRGVEALMNLVFRMLGYNDNYGCNALLPMFRV